MTPNYPDPRTSTENITPHHNTNKQLSQQKSE
jgi:hypothetical protein